MFKKKKKIKEKESKMILFFFSFLAEFDIIIMIRKGMWECFSTICQNFYEVKVWQKVKRKMEREEYLLILLF